MRRLVVVALLAACSKPAPVAPAAEPTPTTDARVEIVPETDGRPEVMLALNRLGKNLKVYFNTFADLPPSSVVVLPGPDGHACKHPDGRFPVSDQWANDPGFGAAEFSIDEPSLWSYHWTRDSAMSGRALATGDRDCDGVMVTYALSVTTPNGYVEFVITEPPPGAD